MYRPPCSTPGKLQLVHCLHRLNWAPKIAAASPSIVNHLPGCSHGIARTSSSSSSSAAISSLPEPVDEQRLAVDEQQRLAGMPTKNMDVDKRGRRQRWFEKQSEEITILSTGRPIKNTELAVVYQTDVIQPIRAPEWMDLEEKRMLYERLGVDNEATDGRQKPEYPQKLSSAVTLANGRTVRHNEYAIDYFAPSLRQLELEQNMGVGTLPTTTTEVPKLLVPLNEEEEEELFEIKYWRKHLQLDAINIISVLTLICIFYLANRDAFNNHMAELKGQKEAWSWKTSKLMEEDDYAVPVVEEEERGKRPRLQR